MKEWPTLEFSKNTLDLQLSAFAHSNNYEASHSHDTQWPILLLVQRKTFASDFFGKQTMSTETRAQTMIWPHLRNWQYPVQVVGIPKSFYTHRILPKTDSRYNWCWFWPMKRDWSLYPSLQSFKVRDRVMKLMTSYVQHANGQHSVCGREQRRRKLKMHSISVE